MLSRRLSGACVLGAVLLIVGCGEDATAPRPVDPAISSFTSPNDSLAKLVRQLTAGRGITPLRRPGRFGRRWCSSVRRSPSTGSSAATATSPA